MNIKNTIKTTNYVATGFVYACASLAQVAPDAGSILREQQKPTLELPTRPAPSIKLEEAARPALKPSAARFALKGFRISGNTAFMQVELLVLVQDYVGKEVSFSDLEAAAARISHYYRERGYLVARAYLPTQDIEDGVVEIAVIEGRFGKINLNNATRVRDGVARGYTESLRGTVVHEPAIERQLLLLDDLAGVGEARATLRPGANVGETDLEVELIGEPPVTGSLEFDNQGNRFSGMNRLTGKLNLLSPLGLGDSFGAWLTKGFDGLEYGRLAYQIPLGGDGLKLGAAYSNTRYRLGRNFVALDASGESDTYTLGVSYPFIRTRGFNLYGQVAYDWRDFQDRIGSTATVTDKHTRLATFTLSGDARDALGEGGVSVFSLAYTGGRLNIETPLARANDDASARTNGHYGKWNLNVLRLQNLGGLLSAYFSLTAQATDKNLDSSEKFILGGANGVRAYPQGEASGDSGYIVTAELRYTATVAALPGVLQPFVFFDSGSVTINENSFAATANHRRLSGAGFGVIWTKANDFQVKITFATRVGSQPSVSSDTDRHTHIWVQAVKYF